MKSRGKAHCHCGKEIPDEQYSIDEHSWVAIQFCSQKCKDVKYGGHVMTDKGVKV